MLTINPFSLASSLHLTPCTAEQRRSIHYPMLNQIATRSQEKGNGGKVKAVLLLTCLLARKNMIRVLPFQNTLDLIVLFLPIDQEHMIIKEIIQGQMITALGT